MSINASNNPYPDSPDASPTKLDKGGYDGTAETLDNKIDEILAEAKILINNTLVGSASLGSIVPSSVPPATGAVHAFATQAGTYTNWGGYVIPANTFALISRSSNLVFSISQTALDVSGKVNVSDFIDYVKPSVGKNLYNKLTNSLNVSIDFNTGALITNTGYQTSNFIKVIPSTLYQVTRASFIGYYDENKTFISRGTGIVTSFTTLPNAKFIRFSDANSFMIGNTQLEAGTSPTTYEAYSNLFPVANIPPLTDYSKNADTNKIFFDPTWIEGSYITPTGNVLSDPNYRRIDFIPVLPNEIYATNVNHRICYYNIDKVFISGEIPNISVTTPNEAYYVRFSTTNSINAYFYNQVNMFRNLATKTDLKIIENTFNEIENSVNEVEKKLILNEDKQGYYTSSGSFSADVTYIAENIYKPCLNIKNLYFSRVLTFVNTERIVFYDKNKTIISISTLANEVSVPISAYYFRYSYLVAKLKPEIIEQNLLKEYVDFGIINSLLSERLTEIPVNKIGAGIYQTDGSVLSDSLYLRSEYTIPENSLLEFYLTTINNDGNISVLFLDSLNVTISSLILPNGVNRDVMISPPSNTKKIRFNSYKKWTILSCKFYGQVTDNLELNYKSNVFSRYLYKLYYKDEYYCKIKFNIGVDMESSNIEYDLFNYADLSVKLVCATPTKAYPSPIVNCGIKSNMYGGIRFLKFKPVLSDIFSIRKIGSIPGETSLTVSDLNYYAKVGLSEFIIYNGTTEVANLSFTSYPKVKDVVNYINSNLSTLFVAKIYKTGEFLMSNLAKKEVSLVGYFTNESNVQILDSAEIFFEKNGVGTTHELEIRQVKLSTGYARTYITIDGNFIGQHDGNIIFNKNENLYIGGTSDILIAPIYVESFVFKKEVPVVKKSLIYMMHRLIESPEGTLQSERTTADRFFRTISDLKDNGYVFPNGDDMLSYILKEKEAPNKSAFFVFDDTDIDHEILVKVSDFLSKYNIKPMTAIIGTDVFTLNSESEITQNVNQLALFNDLKNMSNNGYKMISHSYSHISYTKSSYNSVLKDIQNYSKIKSLGLKTNVMIYPGGACNDYSARLINNNGYSVSFTATENAGKEHQYETPYIGYHNLQRTGIQEINVPDYNNVLSLIKKDLLRD